MYTKNTKSALKRQQKNLKAKKIRRNHDKIAISA